LTPAEPPSIGSDPDPIFRAELDPNLRAVGLGVVRDRLREWLLAAGVAAPTVAEILVATGEACANAHEHSGARRTAEGPAGWVEAVVEANCVRVVVVDRGRWVDRDPATFARRNRGRGRLLMAGLMNRVTVLSGGDGTTVTLLKELPATRD
jgi:anti-sigma regulatory factor (Ser/Thr protein kinase)